MWISYAEYFEGGHGSGFAERAATQEPALERMEKNEKDNMFDLNN